MTHEHYVDLIEARILFIKKLRQQLDSIDAARAISSNGNEKMAVLANERLGELNKLIAEDVALLAEVTSVDRI